MIAVKHRLRAEGKTRGDIREFTILRELRLSLAWLNIHGLATNKEVDKLHLRLRKRIVASGFTMALVEESLP